MEAYAVRVGCGDAAGLELGLAHFALRRSTGRGRNLPFRSLDGLDVMRREPSFHALAEARRAEGKPAFAWALMVDEGILEAPKGALPIDRRRKLCFELLIVEFFDEMFHPSVLLVR